MANVVSLYAGIKLLKGSVFLIILEEILDKKKDDSDFLRVEELLLKRGDRVILDHVNVSLKKGETLALMGLSGAGKSTLIRCIIGLLSPTSGKILINGENVANLRGHDLDNLRRRIGMVFQSPALFDSLTIMDNVAFGLRENTKTPESEVKERVRNALAIVGLSGTENQYPSELSGGMQKRASIARAIVTSPEMILYDEPTSGLDPIMSSVINDLVNSLKKRFNMTSIVVTHDLKSAYAIADKIILLYKGKFLLVGSVDDFKNSTDPVVRQFIDGSSDGPVKM